MRFKACIGRAYCTEDGERCRACGRSHAEIAATRELVARVHAFVTEMDYDNPEEFLAYLTRKVGKKLAAAASRAPEECTS